MPWRRSLGSWLCQVESYLRIMGMAGLASAWAMARRRPKEYRRKVDAATRCSGVCPHTCVAASILRRYSFGFRLAVAQADAMPAMPIILR